MKQFIDLNFAGSAFVDLRSWRWMAIVFGAVGVLAGCTTLESHGPSKPLAQNDSAPPVSPAPGEDSPSRQTTDSRTAEVKANAAKPSGTGQPVAGWQPLFDGTSLRGWKQTEFGGHGEVTVKDGLLMIQMGAMLTGVTWTNQIPKTEYEVELEAIKIDGSDFFCGLTFPVGDSFCSFIVGGWGGGVVGLSSIDGQDASENETTKYMPFEKNRWYRIRLRVTPTRIQTWIDDDRIVDQSIEGRKISLRPGEIEYSVPLGLATWQTTGAFRNIRLRRLEPKSAPAERK
jgi:hypothetical protein